MTQKVKCGDTEWCTECANARQDESDAPFVTRNGMGRCDYYRPSIDAQRENKACQGNP